MGRQKILKAPFKLRTRVEAETIDKIEWLLDRCPWRWKHRSYGRVIDVLVNEEFSRMDVGAEAADLTDEQKKQCQDRDNL